VINGPDLRFPNFSQLFHPNANGQILLLTENTGMDKVPSASLERRSVRIMLVDDHPNTAITLARAISRLRDGIEVVSATSGTQALEFAEQDAVDILITDMMMPGMNGFELIERLQAHPAGRPSHTILMTAYDVPGLKETARRLNVHDTIIKPVPTERICQIINQVLDNMGRTGGQLQTKESTHRFKILIADDVMDNQVLLSRYMKNEGYDYITASDGVQVLEKARREMPDLILLDVNMPEKDGFTALQELRADPAIRHIPVIILTAAHPSPNDVQWGLNLGADDYITKPFDKRELLARIRTKLRVKEAEDVIRRRNRELSVLPEIGKELSARLDINELADAVLHRTVETLGAVMGHIILLDSKGPVHKKYGVSAPTSVVQEIHFPPLNELVDQIRETRQGLIIENTQADPRWQGVQDTPARSMIIVPMFGHLDLIGLLILSHEQTGYFGLDHLLLLQAIASQASIAVENAQLYEHRTQEQSRLAAVLQGAGDAIMMFDTDGCLSLLNPTAERLFTDHQTKRGVPLARNCGYNKLIALLEDVLASGKSRTEDILWPDQRTLSASFSYIERGGCVVLLHDVSHFKALERVKDEFIATASHDLRNPIMAISGFSQLLPAAGPLNEQQQEFARYIYLAAENMKELVENMLDLAKIDAGTELKCESVDMNKLLAEIAQEFEPQAKAKQQKLTCKTSGMSSRVQGDPFQLKQVLRNLVGNAIKYTPANGTVSLAVEPEQYTVSVHVKDTGYGIPVEDLPHIFERFYRVRNGATSDIKGNGLGLAIVQSIIEQHAGKTNVESIVGKGSCFTISLPLVPTAEV
jgi:signal transduction histidine kinase/DNA-binding response OmpR family regulator